MKKSLILLLPLLLASCSNLKDSSTSDQPLKNHSIVNLFDFSLKNFKEVSIMHTAMSSTRFIFNEEMIKQFYGYITQEDYVVCKSEKNSICNKMISNSESYYYYKIYVEGSGTYNIEYYNGYFIVDRAFHTNIPIKLDDSLLIGNLVPGYEVR